MASSLASNDLDFSKIPGRVLNVSSRMCLSRLLNPKQPLLSSNGCARDYRGLAELMDFEYMDIRNFERHEDPTIKILEAWEEKSTATLGNLMDFLKQMEREDVIHDALPLFRNDAMAYVRRKMVEYEAPLQVPEVTSCRALDLRMGSALDLRMGSTDTLTVDDLRCETGYALYDAYICYAEEDFPFIDRFVGYLESPKIGLKLFIKGRDLLPGVQEFDAYVKLIVERCRRMIIILSPDFLKSPECEFQTHFATGLSIEERNRKLIPIIYKECECPAILRFVTKIKFSKAEISDWLWEKLLITLRGRPNSSHQPELLTRKRSTMINNNSTLTDLQNRSQYPEIAFSGSLQNLSITFPGTSRATRKTSQTTESITGSVFSGSSPMSEWVLISEDERITTGPVVTFPPSSQYPMDPTEEPIPAVEVTPSSSRGSASSQSSSGDLSSGCSLCTKKKGFKNFFKIKLGFKGSSSSSEFSSESDKINDTIEVACEVETPF